MFCARCIRIEIAKSTEIVLDILLIFLKGVMKMSKKYNLAIPFVKWVGGKRQLLPEIHKVMPLRSEISTYYEPFVGGGAVFLNLEPKKAVINDFNGELINTYEVIQEDVEALILSLKDHKNDSEYFYKLRAQDRTEEFLNWSKIQRASRFIYLNKTCYNGLYRVNSQGFFNTPFGSYKKPNIVNEFVLRELSTYFNKSKITFKNVDFEESLKGIRKGSFVYFDPPYAPLTTTSNFTGYTSGGFDVNEQIRLRDLCDKLNHKGIKFLLSNSNVELIQELYSGRGYTIQEVDAKRSINSKGDKRGNVGEVLIFNYNIER